jgi:hypothetical protein
MRVYPSTNLWNFYTNKTVYSSTVYHLVKISKETPQQLKHTRTKLYIYVIPEYRVPWLEIYKYPLPDGGLLRDSGI